MTTEGEIVTVPLDKLRRGPRVRAGSIDLDHVARLAPVLDLCPPIIVREDTGEILDGTHRWTAAQQQHRAGIRAVYVACTDIEAWEIAAKANTTHGKPLERLERRDAALRLLKGTDWADARIAAACGLSDKTIADLRAECPTSEIPKLDTREGGDGKRRPVNPEAARIAAADEIKSDPSKSDRAVARRTGLSPTTIASVRSAVEKGDDPVPPRLRKTAMRMTETPVLPTDREPTVADVVTLIPHPWAKHPACERSNTARAFGKFMDRHAPFLGWEDWAAHVDVVPVELVAAAICEAKAHAANWQRFADELANRDNTLEVAG